MLALPGLSRPVRVTRMGRAVGGVPTPPYSLRVRVVEALFEHLLQRAAHAHLGAPKEHRLRTDRVRSMLHKQVFTATHRLTSACVGPPPHTGHLPAAPCCPVAPSPNHACLYL